MKGTRYVFDDKGPFLHKLKELVGQGMRSEQMDVVVPYPMHEIEHILKLKQSKLRFFTLFGALAGFLSGFALTLGTVADWPLITGGKPLMSIPAFLVIAFELTILFGAIASFAGFLILARLPAPRTVLEPIEHNNQFTIVVRDGEGS
jgi:hypothetical protein